MLWEKLRAIGGQLFFLRMRWLLSACVIAFCAAESKAGVIIQAFEDSAGVSFHWEGDLDISGVTFASRNTRSAVGLITPNSGLFLGYSPSTNFIDLSNSVLTPSAQAFGTGFFQLATSFDGDPFGFDFNGAIGLPAGYESGEAIAGELHFDSRSFESIGIDPQQQDLTWFLPSGDTIVFVVPEPTALALFGLSGLTWFKRRERR